MSIPISWRLQLLSLLEIMWFASYNTRKKQQGTRMFKDALAIRAHRWQFVHFFDEEVALLWHIVGIFGYSTLREYDRSQSKHVVVEFHGRNKFCDAQARMYASLSPQITSVVQNSELYSVIFFAPCSSSYHAAIFPSLTLITMQWSCQCREPLPGIAPTGFQQLCTFSNIWQWPKRPLLAANLPLKVWIRLSRAATT